MTYRNPRMDQKINDLMEFGHVVAVMPDGRVLDRDERGNLLAVHAPEVVMDYDGPFSMADIRDSHERDMAANLRDQGWEVLTGYSADPGIILRSDQLLAGALEERIREEPGFWVALTVELHPKEDDPEYEDGNGESDAAGWIVARKIGSEDEIAARTQWIAEDVAPFDADPDYQGQRPWRDEDVAMSAPTVFYKGLSERDARNSLMAALHVISEYNHVKGAGNSERYTEAAKEIGAGAYSVRPVPDYRIFRVRALLMPKEGA